MRRDLFLASTLFVTAAMAGSLWAEPVARVGKSNDAWQSDPDRDPRAFHQCGDWGSYVSPLQFSPVSRGRRPVAVRRLARAPVIALTNADAAGLLGVPNDGASAAARYFDLRIAEQQAVRTRAVDHGVGGWSLADQRELDDLTAIRHGPRLAAFRPWLVRALAAWDSADGFSVQACSGTIAVSHQAVGRMPARPVHEALVVFLDSRPRDVFVSWAVGDPAQRE